MSLNRYIHEISSKNHYQSVRSIKKHKCLLSVQSSRCLEQSIYILSNDPRIISEGGRENREQRKADNKTTGPADVDWHYVDSGYSWWSTPVVPFVEHRRVIMKSYFTTYGNYHLPPRSWGVLRAELCARARANACMYNISWWNSCRETCAYTGRTRITFFTGYTLAEKRGLYLLLCYGINLTHAHANQIATQIVASSNNYCTKYASAQI